MTDLSWLLWVLAGTHKKEEIFHQEGTPLEAYTSPQNTLLTSILSSLLHLVYHAFLLPTARFLYHPE